MRLVWCEEPVPAVFAPFAEPSDCPYAVLLELEAGRDFAFEWVEPAGPVATLPPALALLAFLLGDAREALINAGPQACRLRRGG